MKFFTSLVLLTIFSLTVSSNVTEPFRQFLTNFFQTVNGTQWTLNENCLAGASDADVDRIRAAYQARDYITALYYLNDLKNVLVSSCPLQDLGQVGHDLTNAIASGRVATNVLTNYMEIITLLNENLPHIREYELPQIGTFLGRFYNLVILGRTQISLNFLAEVSTSLKLNPTEFLKGFIEGSSLSGYDNQCIRTSDPFLPELAHSVEAIWTAITNRQGIINAFVEFMATANKLKDVESYCHFISLGNDFLSITNPITLAKISYRIIGDLPRIVYEINQIKRFYKEGNSRVVGRSVGSIIHIMFRYTTQ